MTIPRNADKFRPSSHRLHGLVRISEEWNDWIRGRLVGRDNIVIEIGFEEAHLGRVLPGTEVTYLALWRPEGCLFEFQLGNMTKVPQVDDWEKHVSPIIERLKGYRPFKMAVD